jgi:hypothetical protein
MNLCKSGTQSQSSRYCYPQSHRLLSVTLLADTWNENLSQWELWITMLKNWPREMNSNVIHPIFFIEQPVLSVGTKSYLFSWSLTARIGKMFALITMKFWSWRADLNRPMIVLIFGKFLEVHDWITESYLVTINPWHINSEDTGTKRAFVKVQKVLR